MEAIHASWSSIVRDDQAQLAPTYATSRPSEQYAAYARVQHCTSYGPWHLEMTFQQTYSDVVHSDAVPLSAGSPSSSESSITTFDASSRSSPLVNMGFWHTAAAPASGPAPVQFSTHQRQVASVLSTGFPSIPDQLASTRTGLYTSQADLYDQSFSGDAHEASSEQGWQMPNHVTGVLTPEEPAGLDYSDADRYLQDAHDLDFAASHAQGYEARFVSNTDQRQAPGIPVRRQREHSFATSESPSPHDLHARAPSRLLHSAAHIQNQGTDRAPSARTERDDNLRAHQTLPVHPAQIAYSQGAIRPRTITDGTLITAYPATLHLDSASAVSSFYERGYGDTGRAISCCDPEHRPLANASLSDAFAQDTSVQRSNVTHLEAVNLDADIVWARKHGKPEVVDE
ncbi:hypothetical protein TRAPUB_8811 [Trametes pubescens]|uniref:Uncharacterized protein n=1 Tax=Trametes pubescens TaxID=154538 RepID=A0A1M2W499_TRAPU|nr:hypothetical protein TRAPUB_8811 [Trametes pubescens]